MLAIIENWITGVTAAAMIAAIALALTPEGPVKKGMRLACGILMIIAVLRPIKQVSIEDLSYYKTQYEQDLTGYKEKMDGVNKSFTRSIIEEETASYILEKADELGIDCDVKVNLKTSSDGGYPYPYSVDIKSGGYIGRDKKEELSNYIESQCAIPPERQKWSVGK